MNAFWFHAKNIGNEFVKVFFILKFLEDISPFRGATDTPVLSKLITKKITLTLEQEAQVWVS